MKRRDFCDTGATVHRSFALVSFASLALASVQEPALAADKAACVAAYDAGQELRAKSQFRAAREQFLVCADPSCPAATRGDCTTWVGEVEASTPTITFVVTDEGGSDVTGVKILVDGVALADRLDGSALAVDPGPHNFRFEREGVAPIERDVVVREGEKNRQLDVSWATPAAGGGEGAGVGIGSIAPGTWVLGGIGVVALTVFGVLGGVALGEVGEAEDTCMPTCSDSQVSSIRAKFIVADISLGVGIASLGGAVILAVVNLTSADAASATRGPVQVVAIPLWGGAAAAVTVEF